MNWERSREGCAILTCDEGELSRYRLIGLDSRVRAYKYHVQTLPHHLALPCPPPLNPTLVIPCLPLVLSFPPRRPSFLNPVPENYVSDTKGSLMKGQISNFSGCVFLP